MYPPKILRLREAEALEQPVFGHPRPRACRIEYQQSLRRIQGRQGVGHGDVDYGFVDAEVEPGPESGQN